MDTIYVQPVFAPDNFRFERNLNSLTSYFNYVKENNYDMKFAIGGWCPNDDYWNRIVTLINTKGVNNKITLLRFEKNYGKATVVNKLYEKVKEKGVTFKYMLTADSDILFTLETKHLVERLEDVAEKSVAVRNKPFGMVGLQQLGSGCHFESIFQNEYKITNRYGEEERIVYPTSPSGIAGGCLFFSKDAWDKVDGYRVQGNYAGDDAYVCIDMANNGYSWQVTPNVSIIHPQEDDKEWAAWKVKVCQRDTDGIRKTNIDKYIAEADEFWKNHKR